MATMEKFYDYWVGGDPTLQKRFLIHSIFPMITILTSYVLFVEAIGPFLMRNRKPFELRKLMIVYNFTLVAFYFYCLIRGAFFVPVLKFSFFCGSLNSAEHPIIPEIFSLLYQLYTVRYIELLDTVFMVLTKKFHMITPLHVFHHSIVPIFGWFGIRSETSGYLAIVMGMNCFVHIIMYTYYSIAALGPKYQKYIWWKKYLTTLQILQFLAMTIYIFMMYMIGCTNSRFTFSFCAGLTIIFFFLFINYYRQAYKEKEKASFPEIEVRTPNGTLERKSTVKNGSASGIVAYRNAAKKK